MRRDKDFMRLSLRLAGRGYGATSPNPMVGAVLVKRGQIIGRGWHRRAGLPHAEIEALKDARRRRKNPRGATLYVTLEPCCTQGRTPPCTEAIAAAGIRRVIVGAVDPNPRHRGRGLRILRRKGLLVEQGLLADECTALNEAFNHWIVTRRPLVTVKAAMTLDGKIATHSGESKWITGEPARAFAMRLRVGADAILVGINTILADDPALTVRNSKSGMATPGPNRLRRIILDSRARTPLQARVVSDEFSRQTLIVVGKHAPRNRVAALSERAQVLVAPTRAGRIDLKWLLKTLGRKEVASLLVEGGGQVNASFLLPRLAQRIAFFYAPRILGGARAHKAVEGRGARGLEDSVVLGDVSWRRLGRDWLLQARIQETKPKGKRAN
jgi:diaminohydroxyphosphoribosylaminopyrimidine deaminase/5-amino-6-(5-phosphoribosylamino)uracil reductase